MWRLNVLEKRSFFKVSYFSPHCECFFSLYLLPFLPCVLNITLTIVLLTTTTFFLCYSHLVGAVFVEIYEIDKFTFKLSFKIETRITSGRLCTVSYPFNIHTNIRAHTHYLVKLYFIILLQLM